MSSIRRHLTYANVVSTICLFLVLGGATAFAAGQLAKGSVGTKQLKKSAVTAAKLKNGAVTGAKLADGSVSAGKLANGAVAGAKIASGAVTGDKIAKGAVGAEKLDPALFIPHVTQTLVATQQVGFPTTSTNVPYAFATPTFTQPAGEDVLYIASITATFGANCKAPRSFQASLVEPAPRALGGQRVLGRAFADDENGVDDELTFTAQFGAFEHGPMTSVGVSVPTEHTLSISLERASCATGSPAGATATVTGAKVDVVGIK